MLQLRFVPTRFGRAGAIYLHALRYAAIVAFSSLLLPRCPFTWSAVAVLDRLLFMHWRRHSSYRVTYDAAINSEQQYIVAEFPHGVRSACCAREHVSL